MVKVKSTFDLIQLQHQIHSNSVTKCYASVFPYLLFPLVDKKKKKTCISFNGPVLFNNHHDQICNNYAYL